MGECRSEFVGLAGRVAVRQDLAFRQHDVAGTAWLGTADVGVAAVAAVADIATGERSYGAMIGCLGKLAGVGGVDHQRIQVDMLVLGTTRVARPLTGLDPRWGTAGTESAKKAVGAAATD